MGQLPKTVNELKITGQYRKDRHGDRGNAELTPGQPGMPRWLTDRAAKDMWYRLAPSLYKSRIATQEDAYALASLCEWWSEWRKAYRAMVKATTTEDRLATQTVARRAWGETSELLKRFGLTPVDRTRIKVDGLGEKTKTEVKFFGGTG